MSRLNQTRVSFSKYRWVLVKKIQDWGVSGAMNKSKEGKANKGQPSWPKKALQMEPLQRRVPLQYQSCRVLVEFGTFGCFFFLLAGRTREGRQTVQMQSQPGDR